MEYDDSSNFSCSSNSDSWFDLEQNLNMDEINKMHYSCNYEEFEIIKQKCLINWNSIGELTKFSQYFNDQWLVSQWSEWKLFSRPAGFSTTNNNTEGFNKVIKKIYTNYERTNVLNACNLK